MCTIDRWTEWNKPKFGEKNDFGIPSYRFIVCNLKLILKTFYIQPVFGSIYFRQKLQNQTV